MLKILRLLSVSSEQPVASVTRQYSGAPVLGCRPVLVTFRWVMVTTDDHVTMSHVRSLRDRAAVLRAAQLVSLAPVSVAEDVTRRTKESRHHLRRFLRQVRRNSPEKVTRLEYDLAIVDGVEYRYNEQRRMVEEAGTRVQAASPSPEAIGDVETRITELEQMMSRQQHIIK